MSVAVDSVDSTSGHVASASPLSWNFTNTAGTKLVVGVSVSQSNPFGAPAVSSVTYAGSSMTLLDSSLTGTPAVSPDTDLLVLYYLDSPATGLNQVQVFFTFTGGPTNKDTLAGAISFTGAASGSSGFSTVAKSQETTLGTNTTATASVSGTTSGNIVVGMLNTGTGGLSVTSPATNIWTLNNSTHTAGDNAAMGYKASSGGTVGVAFAFTADIWMAMAVEVKAPSTTVFVPKNTYMAPILTQ